MLHRHVDHLGSLRQVTDELDRELDHRGHRFVRYADDCNIYVRSERAGQRVMKGVTCFVTRKPRLFSPRARWIGLRSGPS